MRVVLSSFQSLNSFKKSQNWAEKSSNSAIFENCIQVQVKIFLVNLNVLHIGHLIPSCVHVLCPYTQDYSFHVFLSGWEWLGFELNDCPEFFFIVTTASSMLAMDVLLSKLSFPGADLLQSELQKLDTVTAKKPLEFFVRDSEIHGAFL